MTAIRHVWQEHGDEVLTLLGLAYLGLFSWEVVADVSGRALEAAYLLISVCLLADYVARLRAAMRKGRGKGRWFAHHLLDLVVIILPQLRPLRLLRLLVVLRLFGRTTAAALRGRVLTYASGGAALLVWVGALVALDAERHQDGATITSLGQALWWALATVTTVGYGDVAPVTATGRLVAAVFMITGVALIGVVTGTLSSWIVEHARGQAEPQAARPAQTTRGEAQPGPWAGASHRTWGGTAPGQRPDVASTGPRTSAQALPAGDPAGRREPGVLPPAAPPGPRRPGTRRRLVAANRVSVRRRGPGPARRRRRS